MIDDMTDNKTRCEWAHQEKAYFEYHDTEWGVPVHDDRTLFEFLVLEGAQAGLNWLTILKKREGYRRAYADFDVSKVASFDQSDIDRLLSDEGIVRNKLKIERSITNAQKVIEITAEHGSFSNYIWHFVDGEPIQHEWKTMSDMPATIDLSDRISNDLQVRGMSFVGSTIMYAFMQAIGMVNDHTLDCFRYEEVKKLAK